jgi:hypothetical protein
MSLADDLQKLDQLRSSGSLSQPEFEQAKRKLLAPPPDDRDFAADDDPRRFVSDDQERRKRVSDALDEGDESLGRAANRYVSFQIVSGIIGVIIFLVFLFAVVLPTFHRESRLPGNSIEIQWKR